MSGGKIDCYMDCSSFYSILAFKYLLKQRPILATHKVDVEFHPIFLGGVNQGSGNKPPWSLPAKGAYSKFDTLRSQKYHGLSGIEPPPFFPALTLLPQRALCYIKDHFPQSTFEQAWLGMLDTLWIPPQSNIAEPAAFRQCLVSMKLFSDAEVDAICTAATQQEWKDRLTANTKKVLDLGAFGAPWSWVRNAQGQEEPFFGSDRFHFMWEFLGLPWKDIELLTNTAKL
ncbi:putative glutathione S-transferase kappa 1 [Roridomyces roridus]|uniref:Glutathione S-transferase kappa n=1 Tax=Roridomyces roridus TaxID=1738132 RepID=A0AAD7FAF9_9AGAR|nr:putative glutathione S-transferase kappa 1 [Roridomyces roridus]